MCTTSKTTINNMHSHERLRWTAVHLITPQVGRREEPGPARGDGLQRPQQAGGDHRDVEVVAAY